MNIPVSIYEAVIKRAFEEDFCFADITTDNLIPENQISNAVFMAKADGVLCGIEIALHTLKMLDPDAVIEVLKKDGDKLEQSDLVARVQGKTRALLKGERTALNLLQHMSGVATATNAAVCEIEGTGAFITDTRKTLPGLRALEKYAVAIGGGRNHRFSLSDAVMIKDNHIDATGSITAAVETVRSHVGHTVKIEVEVRTLDEAREAVSAKADIIMLDNMKAPEMKKAVEIIGGAAIVEASGGIKTGMLKEIALTGVDVISLGAITHSVKALDISMKIF
jgi:nicotinate-nucleotide pyrophosphorylase (carboxylating)